MGTLVGRCHGVLVAHHRWFSKLSRPWCSLSVYSRTATAPKPKEDVLSGPHEGDYWTDLEPYAGG
eukprot:12929515-Prorocentrum_lima.AAC.1